MLLHSSGNRIKRAVDECGLCQGSSDCPFEFDMLLDYPFVTSSVFDGTSLERSAVALEFVQALAIRTSIPVDHFYIISISPVGNATTDLKVSVGISGGGCVHHCRASFLRHVPQGA